ncbi:MAG: hypothetical protein WCF25_05915 [Acidimicrobiales bacterium]
MRVLRKRVDERSLGEAVPRVQVDVNNEVEALEPEPSVPVREPWKIEQLHAMGPMTGPSHRTFVPIVRAQKEGVPTEVTGATIPTEQL